MKLVRFGEPGQERPGLIDGAGALRDLGRQIGDFAGDALEPDRLARLRDLDPASLPRVDGPVRFGPCVGRVGKIVCAGINYRGLAGQGFALPSEPVLFLKAASAICGPNDPLELPPDCAAVDWEIELAAIVGRRLRRVTETEAAAAIAGYAVFNDISARDWQFGATPEERGTHNGGQWDLGKNHDGFAPIGPWLVTPDEIADPRALPLTLSVDGVAVQSGSTADLLFDAPRLIAHASRFMTLEPGDVIATGTPPGSGFLATPRRYLSAGQTMTATIGGLGTQTRRVVAAAGRAGKRSNERRCPTPA